MLERTVYPISEVLSQRFVYVGKLYQRGLNMNLHHNRICGVDLSMSAPRDLSGIKPQSMPGAGLNCLQPFSDVPDRSTAAVHEEVFASASL